MSTGGIFPGVYVHVGGGGGGMMSKFLASVEGLLPSPAGRENPDTRPCQSQTPSTIHYKK